MTIDIVPVWAVLDYTKQRTVDREMLLVKVATVPHEFENEDQTDIEVFACVTNSSIFTPFFAPADQYWRCSTSITLVFSVTAPIN